MKMWSSLPVAKSSAPDAESRLVAADGEPEGFAIGGGEDVGDAIGSSAFKGIRRGGGLAGGERFAASGVRVDGQEAVVGSGVEGVVGPTEGPDLVGGQAILLGPGGEFSIAGHEDASEEIGDEDALGGGEEAGDAEADDLAAFTEINRAGKSGAGDFREVAASEGQACEDQREIGVVVRFGEWARCARA